MQFETVLYIHLAITWALVGIIWFAQVIHYPLYRKIHDGFVSYERSHLRRAAWLMGPSMLIEAFTALFLLGLAPSGPLATFSVINFILLVLIWISTCLFQVQLHQKLSIRFSRKIHANLLQTNWVRVILWTVRGALVLAMLALLHF